MDQFLTSSLILWPNFADCPLKVSSNLNVQQSWIMVEETSTDLFIINKI